MHVRFPPARGRCRFTSPACPATTAAGTSHRIRREIEIHSQLHHRHIAQMYGAFLVGSWRAVERVRGVLAG